MDTQIIEVTDNALVPYVAQAKQYARKSKAANTQRAYKAAWQKFAAWCEAHGAAARPCAPATLAAYLTSQAASGGSTRSLRVALASIALAHRSAKLPDPTADEDVRAVMAGIEREHGKPPKKKAALSLAELQRMIAACPATLQGKRDKALLLIGWGGAFRRSELAALRIEDMRISDDAVRITLPRSKTDQMGEGLTKTIPRMGNALCPVKALSDWLAHSQIQSGALFRMIGRTGRLSDKRLSDKAIARTIKQCAQRAGLSPQQFSGHSLRSGFITAAALGGVESRDIMQQTGHKSERVMRGYIQDAGAGAAAAVRGAFGEKAQGA